VRERYIRVAAIDNVITEGSWNICVVNRFKDTPYITTARNAQDRMDLVFTAKFSSIYYSLTYQKEDDNTVQIQTYEQLGCHMRMNEKGVCK